MREMLEQYLERIIAITVAAEMVIPVDPPEDTSHLEYQRMRMARTLTAYQLFVNRELFQPLLASSDSTDVECGRTLRAECATLADAMRAHTRKWAVQPPAGKWDEYRPAALAMIGRIRAHTLRVRAGAERLERDAGKQSLPADAMPYAGESYLRQMARTSL
jgi:hypothetical protein